MRQNFYHRTTYSIEANFCMGIMGSMFIQWILNTFSVEQDRILNGRHKQRKWVDVVIYMVDVFKTILSDLESHMLGQLQLIGCDTKGWAFLYAGN